MSATSTITIVDLFKDWVFTNPPNSDALYIRITDTNSDGEDVVLYEYSPDEIVRTFIERYTEWLFPYCNIQSRFTNYNDPHNTFFMQWVSYKYDNMPNWKRIAHAYNLDYNPIHNYDRNENEYYTDNTNISRKDEYDNYKVSQDLPPSTTTTHTYGSGETGDEKGVQNSLKSSTYDSVTPVETTLSNTTGTESTTVKYNDKTSVDTTTTGSHTNSGYDNKTFNRSLNVYGNIGVTTSSQMLADEIKLRRFDMLDHIIDGFAHKYFFLA